jgi:hypothetical protein
MKMLYIKLTITNMVKKQGVDFIYEKFDKNTIFTYVTSS